MDAFAALRLAGGTAFLVAAAVSDVRSRRVRNVLWVVMGSLGLALLAAELVLGSADPARYALLVSAAAWFYAVFYGKPLFDEDGFHARPVRLVVMVGGLAVFLASVARASALRGPEATAYGQMASMPILVLLYQGMYRVRLLHGGADTKGLIALTLLVPTYPEASPFPWLTLDARIADAMHLLFPFSFVVFVNAAVLFLAVPVAYLLVNAVRGDLGFPQAFFGTRAPLDALPEHAWLMEKIDRRGEHVLVLFPRRDVDREAEAAKLREAGVSKAWVTHQAPFMVPLLAGFLLAFFAGNLLLGLLIAVLPRP